MKKLALVFFALISTSVFAQMDNGSEYTKDIYERIGANFLGISLNRLDWKPKTKGIITGFSPQSIYVMSNSGGVSRPQAAVMGEKLWNFFKTEGEAMLSEKDPSDEYYEELGTKFLGIGPKQGEELDWEKKGEARVMGRKLCSFAEDMIDNSLTLYDTFLTSEIAETESFPLILTKKAIELLIDKALGDRYLENARDDLTKANKMISELPEKDDVLTSKFDSAEDLIKERPTKNLINRIKDAYPEFYKGNTSTDNSMKAIIAMLNSLESLQGKLKTLVITQIALGTPENNFEDNIFNAYLKVSQQSLIPTYRDHLINNIRVLILCKNDIVMISKNKQLSIVDFFSKDEVLPFTQVFLGYSTKGFLPLSEKSFKDPDISKMISPSEMVKGVAKFNLINQDLLKE